MIRNWILAFRPKTLTASVVPILAAATLATREGHAVSFSLVCFCLLSAVCIQIATNLFNDAIDFRKGADSSERLGPKRVTQSGLFSESAVWKMAFLFLLLAVVFGVPIVLKAGWPILMIGCVSLFLAYSYTGGPFPLAYLGLGDLFVLIFFGWIAVGGAYFLFSATYSTGAFVLGTQLGLLATVLIAINNLRDIDQDRKANKKTLAVRLGPALAKVEIVFLIALAFGLLFHWIFVFESLWFALPAIILPLGLAITRGIYTYSPSQIYNQFLAWSAALHGGFGLIISLLFILA